MFVRLFRIKASESLEKNLARAIYKEEEWRNGEKKALYNLRMPKNIMATSLFLPHFDVICDLLMNRPTAIRNLFV